MNTGIFGEGFPYSNFHDLNMDWIIKIAKDFLDQYTHIQEIIEQGKTDIQELTDSGLEQLQESIDSGLEQLQEKADNLEELLQEWYNTHSEDIANQLASAINDLNTWYTTHEGYLDTYVQNSITAFNTAAETKARETIETIPSDYTALSDSVLLLQKTLGGRVIDGELFTPLLKFYEYDTTDITPTYTSGSICLATGLIGTFNQSRITNKITLDEGSLYHISGLAFPDEGSYFIFYDVDDNVSATLLVLGVNINRKDFYVIGSQYYKSVIVNTGLSSDAIIEKITITKNYLENPVMSILKSIPYSNIPLTMNNSMLINIDGEAISYPAGGDTWRVSDEIDITNYSAIKIHTRMGYDNCYYAFYDASHNPVSYLNSPHSEIAEYDNVVLVPANATYMRVSVFGSSYPVTVGIIQSMETLPDTLESTMERLPYYELPYTRTNEMVIDDTGTPTSYPAGGDTWGISDEVDITGYEILKIIAKTGYDNSYYAFYDASHNPIGYLNSPHSDIAEFNGVVFVPSNAKYIRISMFGSSYTGHIEAPSESADKYYWRGKKWVCIGDSLTASTPASSKNYYTYISEETGITPLNYGVSGTGYANPHGTDGTFGDRVANIPTDADVYTFFGSFNDYGPYHDDSMPIGTASDTGTSTICGCINTALDAIFTRIPLANVGIIAPTPWESINSVTSWGTFGRDYTNALKAVCERRSVPFLNMYTESGLRPWDSNFVALAYSHDSLHGVHPDETGHKIISTKILNFLHSLLD